MTTFVEMIIGTTATVLANGLGGLPFLFTKKFPDTIARLSWAVSGGLMLSASVFNLIVPALHEGTIMQLAVGIIFGALTMVATSFWLNRHEYHVEGMSASGSRRIILVMSTLFIHSFPEGIAIGVAYGSGEVNMGLIMAIAISIHNIPEGLAVALPLRSEGMSGWKCIGWAIFSGVPQLIAAVPAYMAVIVFHQMLPFAFGFAAGAMILLVMSEMIPESRSTEGQRVSSAAAGMIGFLLMMLLQNVIVPNVP